MEVIRKSFSPDRPVSILDWGAGHGRFKLWLSQQPDDVQQRITYFAYEPDADAAAEHTDRVMRATGKSSQLASSMKEVRKFSHSVGGFDFIILSNVLHEIDPAKWVSEFRAMFSVISTAGRLLILEDLQIPIGELPNATGFILMDRRACAHLFEIAESNVIEQRSADPLRADRLACFNIPAPLLASVSEGSLSRCLKGLNERALHAIQKRRNRPVAKTAKSVSQKDGHIHALHLLQYANTAIALENI